MRPSMPPEPDWAVSPDRHDLRSNLTPDAPDTRGFDDDRGQTGYIHSFEAGSLVDGPGVRATVFLAGCLLRCQYCHNPDTWHLKHGARIDIDTAVSRLEDFAPALRQMRGGVTLSGGEPLVQHGFARRLLTAAKFNGLHTALDTSGYLGARADESFLRLVDLVLLDIKSGEPGLYKRLTGVELAPTLAFAERLAAIGKPVWVRYVLVPGLTDRPANIRSVARFLAPMANVEWVEVLPFHQMGAFKWRALGLPYPLEATPPASAELVARTISLFQEEGCRAR